MSRDLPKDATYFNVQFVFLFPLALYPSLLPANKAGNNNNIVLSSDTRLYLFYTNTMSRPTIQTLTGYGAPDIIYFVIVVIIP